jgi:nitroreductase
VTDTSGRAFVELILSRRSIREDFRIDPVDPELVDLVVAAGLAAPSSKNAQPWRLHVVEDVTVIGSIADAVLKAKGIDSYVPHDPITGAPQGAYRSTVSASARVLSQVPVAILVENLAPFSAGRDRLSAASRAHLTDSLEGYTFEVIGLGAAIENMWLAAHALGLAAAFMGDVVVAEPTIRTSFGLVGDLVGVVALGWSDGSPHPPMDAPAFADVPRAVWHSRTAGAGSDEP